LRYDSSALYEKRHWHSGEARGGPPTRDRPPAAGETGGQTEGAAGESGPVGPRAPTVRRLPPEVLSRGEAARLLAACDTGHPTGLRNAALVALLYRAGLRISETLALAPKDLDLEAGAVRVLHAKGGRSRTVGIDPGGASHISEWLVARSGLGLVPIAPLLCTSYGDPLTPGYARLLLKRLGVRAGIDKRVHPHGLRHTHAAELRAEGVDIAIISKQLGHQSIATTARYLDHLMPADVIRAMKNRA
jgi:site-specific recombinase XerD